MIFFAIKDILTDYELWSVIKVLICDTMNTNIRDNTGVVQLQRYFQQNYGYAPQYVGC